MSKIEIDPLIDILNALSEVPLQYIDKRQALKRITELGRKALNSHACTLIFVDLENRCITHEACAGFDEEYEKHMAGRQIKLGSSKDGVHLDFDLFAKGEEVTIDNLQENGQGVANPDIARKYNLYSVMGYPLNSDGRLIGYFNHFSSEYHHFYKNERELIKIFARQAVLTIERFEHYRMLERSSISLKRLERLNEIMQEMTKARDVDKLLELILDRGLELIGFRRGWISRLNFKTGELDVVADHDNPPKRPPLKLGQGITGKALQEERPIRADNVYSPEWNGIYVEIWPDTHSELAVPILINNAEIRKGRKINFGSKPIGVFNVESPDPCAFFQADEDILWSLARHAAIMIERLEFDQKLAKLAKIEKEILGRKNWDEIINIVMQGITETLGFAYVNVSLVNPEHTRIKTEYVIGYPDNEVEEFKRMADHSLDSNDIQADIVRSKQIEVPDIEDKRFDPGIRKRFRHDRLIRGVYMPMIVPSDDRVIGTIEAGYEISHRNYIYERDIQILKGFVDYVTLALEQRKKWLLEQIGHEFRSAIVGIKSNASFLQRRVEELTQDLIQRKFDDILTDCEILLFQVKELEHILGLPAPISKIEKTVVVRDIIIKTIKQLKPLIAEQGFHLSKIEYNPADIPKIIIYVDKAKLNQVVYNLLTNSIKYAEDGPDLFTIRILVNETKDNFIIKFKDWGIGIGKEFSEKIFEEGFRTPEAVSKNVTGSGLGLTISRKIMREFGGDLVLANNDKPTEFHMILPKRLKEDPNDSFRRR